MIEVFGNIWQYNADIRFITTNGTVLPNGCCAMGAGTALIAREKYPGLDKKLGQRIKKHGNTIFYFEEFRLATFPVKHNWWETADLDLIKTSAQRLVDTCGLEEGTTVVIPRPGCGNGHLDWEDVRLILEPIFVSDQIHVITRKP